MAAHTAHRIAFALLFCAASLANVRGQEDTTTPTREIENLKAFTRLYGYIRFFHPSDEAQQIDWDRFAAYGSDRVRPAKDTSQLLETLEELFSPLAPTLKIYAGDEAAPGDQPAASAAAADQPVVAWQHIGVGLGPSYLYKSARTERKTVVAYAGDAFANVMQMIDATPLRGRRVRWTFQARMADGGGQLQGWLRVDRPQQQSGFFDNMDDRPIRSKDWQRYEIAGDVSDDATHVAFGVFLMGSGSGLIDHAAMEIQDEHDQWQPVDIKNPNFELGLLSPAGWGTHGNGFKFAFEKEDPAEGKRAMRITQVTETLDRLFEQTPPLGEVLDKPLAAGLRCRFPVTLPVEPKYTPGSSVPLDNLAAAVKSVDFTQLSQAQLAVADVVIAWNIFQHFYPYFDQVETDWPRALDDALRGAIASRSVADTYHVVAGMVARLHDGHGFVTHPAYEATRGSLPITLDWIEDRLVVVASDDDQVQVGDVVTELSGRPALEVLKQAETWLSGSPQFCRLSATRSVTRGPDGERTTLTVQRGGDDHSVTLVFSKDRQRPRPPARQNFEQLSDGVYYVSLVGTAPDEINPRLEELAQAKAVIFDLRGYPNGTHFLLQHMTDESLQSQQWLVPRRIYPDQERLVDYGRDGRWVLPPLKPRFAGKVIFLTNAQAISYAESFLSIVAHYHLADIVGQPTAGANGNVNPFQLPDGTSVSWTGMRVINHDDTQHHVRGVQPTVRVEPTIAAIREGRDEYIEAALRLIADGS